MSKINLNLNPRSSGPSSTSNRTKGIGPAYARWIMDNYGAAHKEELKKQRSRKNAQQFKAEIDGASLDAPTDMPLVGIVGGGFTGLYAGLILQSLGIEFEIFENSERVGGRIYTWYSSDYSDTDTEKSGLYGEVGGMRLPQFSEDMLPVQQLALAVNAVLERNGRSADIVKWRKFYYNSEVQRMRYNNMDVSINAVDATLNTLNFDAASGGDIPNAWFVEKTDAKGNPYLPINMVFGQVVGKFVDELSTSFATGFSSLMKYDQYSMWAYLTTVFTLGDLGEYYDPAFGAKSELLPWSVASFLETTQVGTNMNRVSFVEMVIALYDWGGSANPYLAKDDPIATNPFTQVFMLTVDKGMQHFPDACHAVLNMADAVTVQDGVTAQEQIGMLKVEIDNKRQYNYNPPNLTPDAVPPQLRGNYSPSVAPAVGTPAAEKQRVFLNNKVTELSYDASLFNGHGGMNMKVIDNSGPSTSEKQYPYVISTLPFGNYLNGELSDNLLSNLSFTKATAIREVNYMSSFKAFITFKSQFWAEAGERQDKGLGVAVTDRPNRQIVYPSYGYPENGTGPQEGVLQIYCWAEDAMRLGALSDEERVNECLKGIQYLYPEIDVNAEFAGYDDGNTTKTWFWDQKAGGGAFALFAADQFKYLYPTLLTPEFNGCLNIAGEACSVHHGWIVGAMDSAYNSVLNILKQAGAKEKIAQMQRTWGKFSSPDIETDESTANIMEYAFAYNEVDRNAASIAPGSSESIYGNSQYVFDGTIPAYIKDFNTVPAEMMMTNLDVEVQDMLNDQWNDNIAQRNKVQPDPIGPSVVGADETAVEALERIYYGNNFMTVPAPAFWLKDDAEFGRQQTGGFMPDYLTKVSPEDLENLLKEANIPNVEALGDLNEITYIANYRRFLEASTVIPENFYLAKPIIFYKVDANNQLMPVAIQLDLNKEVFTPNMDNAENAWLLAKMQVNCAGQSLHDTIAHQLLTHQICAMVSISVFSEDIFSRDHKVFKLLRPHVVKTVEFMQTIYNREYDPNAAGFPETRTVNPHPGVYQLGFVYDLIFSCGRIGNYQLQDKVYNNPDFRFLDLAVTTDSCNRGVEDTPFSYPYVHDGTQWYNAMSNFVNEFVETVYADNAAVADDTELQAFFGKLIPAFNHIEGSKEMANRFPAAVTDKSLLKEVLTMFIWQFSVQHTVVNDGAYNAAAFVPNASTLMYNLPTTPPSEWTAQDVIDSLPDTSVTYPSLGGMNFLDVQLNASVVGQGPYPETVFGRGVLEPSLDFLQDLYMFVDADLRSVVDNYYQGVRQVGAAIQQRQWEDIAKFRELNPDEDNVPATVIFDLVTPANVMTSILT